VEGGVAKKYPNCDMIDVVNEPLHSPASYRNAIGGSGSTGWDWIVWSFEQARRLFPNSKLLINEYGIISDPNAANNYVKIINILKSKNLVDRNTSAISLIWIVFLQVQ
jgi:endo-1,4-beta-xylanase